MIEYCSHLIEILSVQKEIIKRHIAQNKFPDSMVNDEKAMLDFIDKFAWLMRELYCGFACLDRFNCQIALNYLPNAPSLTDSIFSDQLEWARNEIINRHLELHKWYRHIEDTEEAKKSFAAEFDDVIITVICGYTCPNRMNCKNAKANLLPNDKEGESGSTAKNGN